MNALPGARLVNPLRVGSCVIPGVGAASGRTNDWGERMIVPEAAKCGSEERGDRQIFSETLRMFVNACGRGRVPGAPPKFAYGLAAQVSRQGSAELRGGRRVRVPARRGGNVVAETRCALCVSSVSCVVRSSRPARWCVRGQKKGRGGKKISE